MKDIIEKLRKQMLNIEKIGYDENQDSPYFLTMTEASAILAALRQTEGEAVEFRGYAVFNPIGEEWDQMSIMFNTLDEARGFMNRKNKTKYPYLRILAEVKTP